MILAMNGTPAEVDARMKRTGGDVAGIGSADMAQRSVENLLGLMMVVRVNVFNRETVIAASAVRPRAGVRSMAAPPD